MSGGYFDYENYKVDDLAFRLEGHIEDNDSEELTDWGTPRGRKYSRETIKEFTIALGALRLASVYLHRIDWLVSGDDGEDSFHSRLKEDLLECRYLKRSAELLKIFDGEWLPTASGCLSTTK